MDVQLTCTLKPLSAPCRDSGGEACRTGHLAGDPLAHLKLSAASHARAARELCELADRVCEGRVLALGGGGYDRANLALAWTAVVESLLLPRRTSP